MDHESPGAPSHDSPGPPGRDSPEASGGARPSAQFDDVVAGRSRRRITLAIGWVTVLGATDVPLVVADEVFAADPNWLVPAQVALLGSLLLLTTLEERFRSLQSLAVALLAVKAMKTIPVDALQQLFGISLSAGVGEPVAHILLKGGVAVGLLGLFLVVRYDPADLFLRRSDLSATNAPEPVPGFRAERSWRRQGTLWGGLTVLTTVAFLLLAGANFAFWELSTHRAVVLGSLVAVAAAVNAFQEEFVFRAVPLAEITTVIGERHAAVLLGGAFGLSHYYGTPGGVTGVLMTFSLGWWLTKSLIETRGLTLAWTVHFVLDVVILSAWFLT